MHLYASGDAYKKGPGKGPKTLIYKGKKKTFYLMYALYASFYRVSFLFLESSIRD